MLIEEAKKNLTRKLSKEFMVVTQPDHPYLLFPPDLLVSNYNSLVGVFFPKRFELQDFNYLLVRMFLSRLAFPSHYRCVLVVDSDLDAIPQNTESNFHKVLQTHELSSLISFINNPEDRGRVSSINKTKASFFPRFDVIYEETHQMSLKNSEGENPLGLLQTLTEHGKYNPATIKTWTRQQKNNQKSEFCFRYKQNVISAITFPASPDIEELRRLYKDVLLITYSLDNGIPYMATPTTNVLIVNKFPLIGYDPFQLIRATAFAGWSMIAASSVDEVEQFINFLAEKLEEARE